MFDTNYENTRHKLDMLVMCKQFDECKVRNSWQKCWFIANLH